MMWEYIYSLSASNITVNVRLYLVIHIALTPPPWDIHKPLINFIIRNQLHNHWTPSKRVTSGV